MDFDLSEEQRAIQDTARAFARDEMMPFARQWDEDEIFPADTLRQAAALGFAGINVSGDGGGSALTRLDATLIFEELAQGCPSTAAYISIHNMVASMIDGLWLRRAACALSPIALRHGLVRQLLPDRARLWLRCGEPEDPRHPPARPLCARRRQGVHFRRRRLRRLRGDGAHRRGRAARHFLLSGGEGHARARVRREGEKARLAFAADRHGDIRAVPRAGREPVSARKGRASRSP